MGPALVIKPNPVTDDSIGMLQGLKPLTMNTLLFQGSDYTLDHPVLLRTVGRNELLLQTVASDQCCEAPAGKDQAIVRSQQEGLLHSAQGSKPGNQGLLQGRLSRSGFARTRTDASPEALGCSSRLPAPGPPNRPDPPRCGKDRSPSVHQERPPQREVPPLEA